MGIEKRQKIGNAEFLIKYIQMYESLDKINKLVYPIIVCLCLMIEIWRIVLSAKNPSFENFAFTIVSLLLVISWIFLSLMYYNYISYGMYGKRIDKWKAELKK